MLRGVGRIHSQQHAKQGLLAPVGPIERIPTLPFSICSLHSSCTLSGTRALAPNKDRTPHKVTPLIPVHRVPTLTCSKTRSSPCAPCTWRQAEFGQFPSSIIDTIDAFSSATKNRVIAIVSHINTSSNLRRYICHRGPVGRLAQFLASTSRPSRAHSAMTLAHALGCRFKPNHFESVVRQLSLKEHWSAVPRLVSLARCQCGKSTARLLNWKIRAFIESHQFRRLNHVLAEFARDKVQPTRRTFHLLVSGHLRNRDLGSAKQILQLMETAGFAVDASTHAIIITAYRSLGLDPQVHARALEALPCVDVRTSTRILNSIIQHFLDIDDEPSAVEHINRFLAPSTSRRETVHRSGGTTTGEDGALSEAINTSPPSSGRTSVIRPDAATFTILINYLSNKGQFHRIHKVLNRMVEIGVKPDAGVVAALIRTYCLSGCDDMAMSLLVAMLKSNTDAQRVFAFFRVKAIPQLSINVKGIDLTVHVFNAVLPRAMQIRGLSGARFIIRLMQSKGVQSNAATIEAFLDYLDRVGHVATRRLTQVLRSISRNDHGPTIRQLNIILRNALRREDYRVYGCGWNNTAAKFSSRRRDTFTPSGNEHLLGPQNFNPDDNQYHPQNNSCVRPTVHALSRKGVKSDRATFAMWIKHEGIDDPTLGTAKSVFRYMVHNGMHPNRHHFISLMGGFTRAGDMQGAEQVMRSAKAAGIEPDVVMWTVLVSGYARKGEPSSAMGIFRAMVAAGTSPDVPAIDALAHAYFAVGAYSMARKVLLELWPRVKPFPSGLENAPLEQLARTLRQLNDSDALQKKSLTPQEQRYFNRKLHRLLQEWRQI